MSVLRADSLNYLPTELSSLSNKHLPWEITVFSQSFLAYWQCAVNLPWKSYCTTKWMFFRSSRLKRFYKRGVLKNFAKFTGKHLFRVSFLIKLLACEFPVNIAKFLKTFFLQNTSDDYFCCLELSSPLEHRTNIMIFFAGLYNLALIKSTTKPF